MTNMSTENDNLEVDSPNLFICKSAFPPFVWELKERTYPNKLIAASRDIGFLRSIACLVDPRCRVCGYIKYICDGPSHGGMRTHGYNGCSGSCFDRRICPLCNKTDDHLKRSFNGSVAPHYSSSGFSGEK